MQTSTRTLGQYITLINNNKYSKICLWNYETKRNGLEERDYNQMQTSTRSLGQYITLINNNK